MSCRFVLESVHMLIGLFDFSDNICKGYANVGIIGNLENSISSISSIPATYDVSLRLVFTTPNLYLELSISSQKVFD